MMGKPSSASKKLSGMYSWQKPMFRQLLQESDTFVICVELVTSRGVITERGGHRVLELARKLAEYPRIHVLSITDNPGGNAMLGADVLGTDLIARGQEVIIHLSCKDWNRNALQSRGWELASSGFKNVLALSGDCPSSGYEGQASGVFDIDSVALLKMYADMNQGLELVTRGSGGQPVKLNRTDFFLGTVVNNFKLHEREVMPQLFKLSKKIETGAQFVINQLGYDSRKQDELIRYMRLNNLDVPVLANVFVLSSTVAKFFNAGNIPGCTVTDELMELCNRHARSPDKGKAFFLDLAARQVAVAKGLGYRGVYLGGHLCYDDYRHIIDTADSFGEEDWKTFARDIQFSRKGEFFLFKQDLGTGLSTDQLNADYLASKTPQSLRQLRRQVPLAYKMNRLVHEKVFEKNSPGFKVGQRVYSKLENTRPSIKKASHRSELALKVLGFNCCDCGDCSLPDIAFLCPESQCAKNQRNGPCGGTRDGKCEVGEKTCIWALAYDRLKAYGHEQQMLNGPVVIKNAALKGTSAWANTFLERDHHAKENGGQRESGKGDQSL